MNRLLTILLLVAGLTVGSCGSSKDKAEQTGNTPDEQIQQSDTDTMTNRPPHPEPGLAPGFAKIHATLVGNTNSSTIQVEVHEVMDYGSSTPPIAVGDTLSVSITNTGARSLENIRKLGTFITVISHEQSPSLGDESPNASWSMRNINDEQ